MQACLSHYRVLEQIDEGGMAYLYRAHDEHLDCDVALKVLKKGKLADDASRKRFRKEALTLSKLNHPNIAVVHDFDSLDGTDFLVEELIEGLSLDTMLASGPLPEKEAVKLGIQLCEGLAFAHEHGVVHRDLKPGNIRITPEARLKILDFGLAHIVQTATPTAVTLSDTRMPSFAGTLPYMAPEQILGRTVDARTDIWAAGCVLYEMVAGKAPFQGRGSTLIEQILHQEIARPSKLHRNVAQGMEAIILKCLERNPARRYESARDVAVDLERLKRGSATRALLTRRRSLAMRIGTTILLIAAAIGSGIWYVGRTASRPRPIKAIAVLPFENLSGDSQQEYFADGMTDSLITDLNKLTGLKKVTGWASVKRFKETKKPPAEIARELGVDALITGAVMRSGYQVRVTAQLIEPQTGVQLWTQQYDRDQQDVLKLQSEMTTAIASEIRIKLTAKQQEALGKVSGVNPEAYDAYLMGRFYKYKFDPISLDKALEYFQKAAEIDPSFDAANLGIAEIWSLRGHLGYVPRLRGLERSEGITRRVLEHESSTGDAHAALASILAWQKWEWAQGEAEFRRALEINPNNADAHFFYSLTLHALRRPEESLGQMERAIELDPYNPAFHFYLAVELIYVGRTDEAHEELRKVASLESLPRAQWARWEAYEQRGQFDEAIDAAKVYYGELARPDLVRALERGYVTRDYKAALVSVADAISAKTDPSRAPVYGGPENPLSVAALYAAAGQDDRALDWLEKAYAIQFGPLPYVNARRRFEHMRGNPHFQDLLRRMNLPQ